MEVQVCSPQAELKEGCKQVLKDCHPSVRNGPLKDTTHLHPILFGSESQVTLNIINGPRSLSIEASLRDTVDQIKQQIKQKGKFGVLGSIGLVFGSQELKGSGTLAELGVKHLAQLFIIHKCTGG
ncbi:hypothetical protein Y1Q_0006428 [Alligator mississippiensis]|uniref:Ubiquitin-like domain-containing protein n=1 Tax=Alligator mississippiensis TaxID=8496 RepID=A0A151NXU2_ALLMI|nr:hypothetical protein Y1Q_0006428 [Alligator mississippiensis]